MSPPHYLYITTRQSLEKRAEFAPRPQRRPETVEVLQPPHFSRRESVVCGEFRIAGDVHAYESAPGREVKVRVQIFVNSVLSPKILENADCYLARICCHCAHAWHTEAVWKVWHGR